MLNKILDQGTLVETAFLLDGGGLTEYHSEYHLGCQRESSPV
jgi:hypothetical protein